MQHRNIPQETWGEWCPLLTETWVAFLQMKEAEEKKQLHNFCWEIKLCLGRMGLAVQVHLRRQREGSSLGNTGLQDRSITCGSYATSGSDFSIYASGYAYVQIHMSSHVSCDEAPGSTQFGEKRETSGKLLKYL